MYSGAGFVATCSAGFLWIFFFSAVQRHVYWLPPCLSHFGLLPVSLSSASFPSRCPEVCLQCLPPVVSSSRSMALASEDWWRGESGCPPPTGAAGAQLCWSLLWKAESEELGVGCTHRHAVNYSSTLGATLIKAGPHRSQDLKFSFLQCLTGSPPLLYLLQFGG